MIAFVIFFSYLVIGFILSALNERFGSQTEEEFLFVMFFWPLITLGLIMLFLFRLITKGIDALCLFLTNLVKKLGGRGT